jgi:hypothetical protein
MVSEGQYIIAAGKQHYDNFCIEDGQIGIVTEVYDNYFVAEFDVGDLAKHTVDYEIGEEGIMWHES